jgi:hypothetical protein
MGLIRTLITALFVQGGAERLGRAGTGLVGAFRPNATRQMELGHDAFAATQAAYAAEFSHAPMGWFDRLINGLNRLPRPVLALATPGLFGYAMVDPGGFSVRMQGLALVPEPLWWLMGAVVAFYFGARETHYLREHRPTVAAAPPATAPAPAAARSNPALADWLDGHEGQ